MSLPAGFVTATMYVPPSLGALTGLRVNVVVPFGVAIPDMLIVMRSVAELIISPFRVQTMLVMGRLNPVNIVLSTRSSPTTTSTDWSGDSTGATVKGQRISDSLDTVESN